MGILPRFTWRTLPRIPFGAGALSNPQVAWVGAAKRREIWSGRWESNPPSWLGKASPAGAQQKQLLSFTDKKSVATHPPCSPAIRRNELAASPAARHQPPESSVATVGELVGSFISFHELSKPFPNTIILRMRYQIVSHLRNAVSVVDCAS